MIQVDPPHLARWVSIQTQNLRRYGVPEGGPLDIELHRACLESANLPLEGETLEVFSPMPVTVHVGVDEHLVWASAGHDLEQVADSSWRANPTHLGLPLYLCLGLQTKAPVVVTAHTSELQFFPFGGANLDGEWLASPLRDRRGHRFSGPAVHRGPEGPSIPITRGVIQVPNPTELIVIGPDGPTLGGYPILGAVVESDLSLLARVPIGSSIRFRAVAFSD